MRIALGVTGGVAAYKAAELVRRLQQEKLDVQVVMTRAAQEFVTPLTFAALTGQKVITDLFSVAGAAPANVESAIEHIAVAQRIDLLLVAPATADILGKFAHGIAEDFLSTLYLATKAPVVVAPAMNVNMWDHPATQENLQALRARGVHVIDPDEGYLACGMTGAGRLAATEAIAKKVCEVLGLRHDFAGQTVLVSAGPTCEDIDPVRFLTNRSSGKMGYALAEAAHRRGAHVVLVSGPTELQIPEGVDWIPVRATEQMHRDRARTRTRSQCRDHGRCRVRLPSSFRAGYENQARRRAIHCWSLNPRRTFSLSWVARRETECSWALPRKQIVSRKMRAASFHAKAPI